MVFCVVQVDIIRQSAHLITLLAARIAQMQEIARQDRYKSLEADMSHVSALFSVVAATR